MRAMERRVLGLLLIASLACGGCAELFFEAVADMGLIAGAVAEFTQPAKPTATEPCLSTQACAWE